MLLIVLHCWRTFALFTKKKKHKKKYIPICLVISRRSFIFHFTDTCIFRAASRACYSVSWLIPFCFAAADLVFLAFDDAIVFEKNEIQIKLQEE